MGITVVTHSFAIRLNLEERAQAKKKKKEAAGAVPGTEQMLT